MNNTENIRYIAQEKSFSGNKYKYCIYVTEDPSILTVTDVSKFLNKYKQKEKEFDNRQFKILHIRHESDIKYTIDELFELVKLFGINRCVWFTESLVIDDHLKCFKDYRVLKLMSYCTEITNEGLKNLKNIEDLELRFSENVDSKGIKYLKKLKRLVVKNCDHIVAHTLSNISTLEYLQYEPCKYEEKYEMLTNKISEKEKKEYNSTFVFKLHHYNKLKNLKRLSLIDNVIEEKLKELLREKDIYGAIPISEY